LKKAIPDPAFSDSIRHCKWLVARFICCHIYLKLLSSFEMCFGDGDKSF
jgi:hypothetical protein